MTRDGETFFFKGIVYESIIENIKNGIAGLAYLAIHFIFIQSSFVGFNFFMFSMSSPFNLMLRCKYCFIDILTFK